MNRPRTALRVTMERCEDAQGNVSELGARLGTVWPLDTVLTRRVKARCLELETDLRALRRALDAMEAAA